MGVYKVSYVVKGKDHPGGILNLDNCPQVGDTFQIGDCTLKVLEIVELMPPRGDFHYIHATCVMVEDD